MSSQSSGTIVRYSFYIARDEMSRRGEERRNANVTIPSARRFPPFPGVAAAVRLWSRDHTFGPGCSTSYRVSALRASIPFATAVGGSGKPCQMPMGQLPTGTAETEKQRAIIPFSRIDPRRRVYYGTLAGLIESLNEATAASVPKEYRLRCYRRFVLRSRGSSPAPDGRNAPSSRYRCRISAVCGRPRVWTPPLMQAFL